MIPFVLGLALILVAVLYAIVRAASFAWSSPLFWILLTALSVVLFPVTLGMSPLAVVVVVMLRLTLMSRIFCPPGRR